MNNCPAAGCEQPAQAQGCPKGELAGSAELIPGCPEPTGYILEMDFSLGLLVWWFFYVSLGFAIEGGKRGLSYGQKRDKFRIG